MGRKKLIIIVIIFIIGISIPFYFIYRPNTFGEINLFYFDLLEKDIKELENTMNDITNNWIELKEIIGNDKPLKETYNLIVKDIKNCYSLATDKDNLSVLGFKNKRYMTDKQLDALNDRKNCLKEFDKYQTRKLSDNASLEKRLKGQLEIIIAYEENDNYSNFTALLLDEAKTINKVLNLSKWLEIEYNTYKKRSDNLRSFLVNY